MKKFFLLGFIFTTSAYATYLDQYCRENKGVVVKFFKCPKSKVTLPWRICKYQNPQEQDEFVDGCTGPTGGFLPIFFNSCIRHDLCYHHEPASNGRSRKSCDLEFLHNLRQACLNDGRNNKKCFFWARTLYQAVRTVGLPAYHCENTPADY